MALLQRITNRRFSPALLRQCSSAPTSEHDTDASATVDSTPTSATPSAEDNASLPKHYRTNRLLPKCAFLFPAKPRVENKQLHLRSLRRSPLSTVSCLHHERPNAPTRQGCTYPEWTVETRRCAWCQTPVDGEEAFCSRCQKILPVERNLNLFRIFDLEPAFEIDIAQLEAKYRSLQMRLHPDRFVNKSQKEQDLATAQASLLNRAFRKLKQPLDRAKYLLRLKGFPFDKEQTIKDPEFLMEMLEMQERVSETDDSEELLDILSETQHRAESLFASLSQTFACNDLNRASDIVTELSYLDRVLHRTRDKM